MSFNMVFVREHLVSVWPSCTTMRHVHSNLIHDLLRHQQLFIFAVTNCITAVTAVILLSFSHRNSVSAALCNLIRTSGIFKPVQYGVLLPAQFATEMSWRNKKRLHKIN